MLLEHVAILHLTVKAYSVKAVVPVKNHAITFVVLIRLKSIYPA